MPLRFSTLALLGAFAISAIPTLVSAQTRTDWQMNRGQGHLPAAGIAHNNQHGNPAFYSLATIPGEGDPNWGPAPDPQIIGFSEPSTVSCFQAVDFTYFQTFVDVPANVEVNAFTIAFEGMDDGSRVTVFNNAHPTGVVDEGSYVMLGGSGTADLADYLVEGRNRVVVTQMDDCAVANNLRSATVVLNGTTLETGPAPGPTVANACEALPGPNSHGDVHITTPDGLTYDFQAAGEFLLLESSDESVVIQTRQEWWERNPRVSVNTAAAMNVDGTTVGFYLTPELGVWLDDTKTSTQNGVPVALPGGGAICRITGDSAGSTFRVTWANGFFAGVRMVNGSHIDVGVSRGSASGSMVFQGLIGNLDGNSGNDLRVRGGEALAGPLVFTELYGTFGHSWRIEGSESLFRYASGTSAARFNRNGVPDRPFTLTDLSESVRSQARQTCVAAGVTTEELLADCTLDVGGTGSSAFVETAVAVQQSLQASGVPIVDGDVVSADGNPFPGVYRLKTRAGMARHCLESNGPNSPVHSGASFMDTCQDVSGQFWTITPVDGVEGYYTLRSGAGGESMCLEGSEAGSAAHSGGAHLTPCQGQSGQMWSISLAQTGNGRFYNLRTQFRGQGECLEGNSADSPTHDGAAFMDACQDVTGQLWRFEAADPEVGARMMESGVRTGGTSGGDGETMTIDGTEVQTGAVQVTLQWNTPVDLDLYVTDPSGDTVSYQNTSVGSGGELDVDARRSCQTTPETVENIIWRANPPRGAYTVRVNYYTACDEGPASYTATLRRGGQVVDTWTGTLTIGESDDHTFSVE